MGAQKLEGFRLSSTYFNLLPWVLSIGSPLCFAAAAYLLARKWPARARRIAASVWGIACLCFLFAIVEPHARDIFGILGRHFSAFCAVTLATMFFYNWRFGIGYRNDNKGE